jgi:hypothetical protein
VLGRRSGGGVAVGVSRRTLGVEVDKGVDALEGVRWRDIMGLHSNSCCRLLLINPGQLPGFCLWGRICCEARSEIPRF